MSKPTQKSKDFIRQQIDSDLNSGLHRSVTTRFPPEPNGYLHIGHAKSICLNFGLAKEYQGACHLRFDDTNPEKEDTEYVNSIQEDVKWLGFEWTGPTRFASDYFAKLFEQALVLIKKGLAFVDDSSDEEIRAKRGSLKVPGTPTSGRSRSVEENLDLFTRMKAGEFKDGSKVLRAKIDLSASNMKMRDPLLYRIRHVEHHRTKNEWCIYPMYDFAHPLSDAFEGITHSICTLEFENNRELYDWLIEHTDVKATPKQYEFARLALDFTMMSKRNLLKLVEQKMVSGWDDPRMPTLAGMRRRGLPAKALRDFCELIGVAKNNTVVDIGKLEYCVRHELNHSSKRRMCVLNPIKVTFSNLPNDFSKDFQMDDYPSDMGKPGKRKVTLTNQINIETSDFEESPDKGFNRLAPGRIVRLRGVGFIKYESHNGTAKEGNLAITAHYLGQEKPEGEKSWGVLHWVDAKHGVDCEVRLYDRLFSDAKPKENFLDSLNKHSLETKNHAVIEPSVLDDGVSASYQFVRTGYFTQDHIDSSPKKLVFNRVVTLKDNWAKKESTPKAATDKPKAKSSKAQTRPDKKTAAEVRESLRKNSPKLQEYFNVFLTNHALDKNDADVLSGNVDSAELFLSVVNEGADSKSVAKLLINELPKQGDTLDGTMASKPSAVAKLLSLAADDTVSAQGMRTIFKILLLKDADPKQIAESEGLIQSNDTSEILEVIQNITSQNSDKVKAYKEGKKSLFGFFMGQVMAQCGKGSNPKLIKSELSKFLDS